MSVIIILIASLAVGLIFIPVLGGLFGRRNPRSEKEEGALAAAESGSLDDLDPVSARYAAKLVLSRFTPQRHEDHSTGSRNLRV